MQKLIWVAVMGTLWMAASGAGAETTPYYIGVSQSFTHESNLLGLSNGQRAPAGLSKSDTISSTSLRAGLDQPIGRQRLFGNVTLSENRLSNNDIYNNRGYSLAGGVDWSTVGRLSGRLDASAVRRLPRFSADEVGLVTARNLETLKQANALVRVGTVTALTGDLRLSTRSLDYSAEAYNPREFTQDSISVGATYRPRAATSVGAALRQTKGKYPKFRALSGGGFQADRYDRRDIDFTGRLEATGASEFSGRLSLTRTEYDVAPQRDYSGITGSFLWNWQPTAKLRFKTTISREPGQDAYFVNEELNDDTMEFSRVTTALRLESIYGYSAKITFNARAYFAHRSLSRTWPAGAGEDANVRGSDDYTNLSIGGAWTPYRSVQLGCNLGHGERRGDPPLSANSRNLSVGCYGQFTLR